MQLLQVSEKSTDTVWFVKILERHETDQPYTDNYCLTAVKGQYFFSGSIWNELVKQDTKHFFKK